MPGRNAGRAQDERRRGSRALTRRIATIALAGSVAAISSPPARAGFFLPLGDLPGGAVASSARSVSNDGRVVVGVDRAASDDVQAFRWTPDTGMVGLGKLPGGTTSRALGVSADGSIVAGWGGSVPGPQMFRWTGGGGLVPLGDLAGGDFRSIAGGVSGNGSVIVGDGDNAVGQVAVRWTSGTGFVVLGYLPGGGVFSSANAANADGSVIVGTSDSALAGGEAFRWTALGGMVGLGGLLGWSSSFAFGVSAGGDFVVGHSIQPIGFLAYRWSELGGMESLGDLPGGPVGSVASAVSADGSVVVGRSETAIGEEAFLWTPADGMRRLKDVLELDLGLDLAGWTLVSAQDVSDDGSYVVGEALDPAGGAQAFLAYLGARDDFDVPAPGTLFLLGAGLFGLTTLRLRGRSSPNDVGGSAASA